MPQLTFIRPGVPSDCPEILRLLAGLGYEGLDRREVESTLEAVFSRRDLFLKVVDAGPGLLAGYVLYSSKPLPRLAGTSVEIDELSIAPECRGSGMGTQLLNEVKFHAHQLNAKRIILSTNRERVSYQRNFYQKFGFVEKNSAWLCLNL